MCDNGRRSGDDFRAFANKLLAVMSGGLAVSENEGSLHVLVLVGWNNEH